MDHQLTLAEFIQHYGLGGGLNMLAVQMTDLSKRPDMTPAQSELLIAARDILWRVHTLEDAKTRELA